MSTGSRVREYLDHHHIRYSLIAHPPSRSSVGSAISADIPLHQLAKGVVLQDKAGNKLMAILPSDYKVDIPQLNETLGRQFKLLREAEIYPLYDDCASGAVPPLPEAYNIEAVYDDELMTQGQIFIESGDHETLVQLDNRDFMKLMAHHQHGHFSNKFIH